MALQVRLSLPDFKSGISFTDPIILEYAENITLSKTVNSEQESISFSVPPNDTKLASGVINYVRWWECWDTATNQRLNYGPIDQITYISGEATQVTGPGRSAVLRDFYKSMQTFYTPINQLIDDLRFENIAGEPRTSTIINKETTSDYYGLSLRSKDNAIDEQTGFIAIGRDTPSRGTIKTDQFWSGVDRADYLTVDLGEKYTISKARILLPWWGGPTINNNRAYDWTWNYSNDNSAFTNVYSTPAPNHHPTPPPDGTTIYYGESGYEVDQITVSGQAAIEAQYWKLNISNTHAWYGNAFTGTTSDEWTWECAESNVFQGNTKDSPTISGGVINTTELTPASDCHASAVELSIYRKIIGRDTIPNLAYHQIEDSSRQITFFHAPEAGEMIAGGKKFEPGTYFRNVTLTGSSVDVKDEYNTLLYSGVTGALKLPAYTRYLTFSAATQVSTVDAWKGVVDALSYGGRYSYTTLANDYAVLQFRGVSIKWFATVPTGSTAAHVMIRLRSKSDSTGDWTSWNTLEADYVLPTGIAGEKVWEITYESGTLLDNTTYELRIDNLNNGGYCSIDAFAGYWSATYNEVNEDDARVKQYVPTDAKQEFDYTEQLGSAYKYTSGAFTKAGLHFTGDRVIVYSRKGSGYGTIKLGLYKISQTSTSGIVAMHIPGGNADGTLDVNLNHSTTIPQAVILDTNDYSTWLGGSNTGLPFDNYVIGIYRDTTQGAAPVYLDGIGVHETSGLSVKFVQTNHQDILKSTAEALQLEWDVTESGIKVLPRLGTDTNIIFAEGLGTTIKIEDVEDVSKVATMLLASGADIDGLPLSTVVEDKKTRGIMGRTIQRLYDSLRNTADYFTLVGASRTELMRRRAPEKRISITTTNLQGTTYGDSVIATKPEYTHRVRIMTISRTQSSSGGTQYDLECIEWPLIE